MTQPEEILVLGIESSCDDTAASVVRGGNKILSSVIYSQDATHTQYGGVVPELASREHLNRIVPAVKEALAKANVNQKAIDGIAVTIGPGLIGSLLVGISYAKAMAYALGKPLVGVNHIEGHIYSIVFDNPPVEYPALALIVSGGHTNLFLVPRPGKYKVLARTRDDAAGEAFDKVAKLLGFGYPGGPVIERLARQGDPCAIHFSVPRMKDGSSDFSFSGLKTAVARHIREYNIDPVKSSNSTDEAEKPIVDLAASFQRVVIESLIETTRKIASKENPQTLIVAGGVSCNLALRAAADKLANEIGKNVYFPSPRLSTDNAAMIAAAGHVKLLNGERDGLDLNADVSLRLQNIDLEREKELRTRVKYRL
ncbi:MAG: tRNA (adenosine(37)-N6)-threonylcarbamoyltransferase complex transferase subunit TsaD [Pyrinomonadaceae bacterium]